MRPYPSTAAVFAGNVAIGAAAAALGHLRHPRKAGAAAIRGGAAGGVVFAGKWIVSKNNAATNLLGRQIAAVGSSGVRNAAAGDGLFKFVTLPYGPIRFHVRTGNHLRIRPALDLVSSIALIRAFKADDLAFDRHRSWISGVPTFETDSAKRSGGLGGSHDAGVIRFRARKGTQIIAPDTLKKIIGHELVHVAQHDFLFSAASEPAETFLLNLIPGGRSFHKYVDVGLHVPLMSILYQAIPYESRPWEREARTLAKK